MHGTSFLDRLFWAGTHVAAVGLAAATLGGFLGRLWWVLDLLSHFRVQYLGAAVLLLAVYALGKRWGWASLVAGLALLNLGLILPLFFPRQAPEMQSPAYRLFLSNVLTANPQHERARRVIEASDADFVALLEVSQRWLDDLNLDALGYGERVAVPRGDNFGIALYSRYPIADSQILYLSKWGLPAIVARVALGGEMVTLVVVHTVPPKTGMLTRVRNAQMAALTDSPARFPHPWMIAGDFNATSWSPYFGAWLKNAGLQDSRRGFGVQPTWRGLHPLLAVPIDHVLVSDGIRVRNRRVGPDIGSDHLPVILDFSVAGQ